MRNKFAETFYECAKRDERLCCVVADISPAGSIAKFREEFPHRFINTGVAEQSMIGIAAGMAQRGLRPFAYTIATFALFRPFEFIRVDLCYQNLPVTIVGIGGGVTYSTLGATHHAQEDIGVALSIPNLKVIAPCDPYETEWATWWCTQDYGNSRGPVYVRLGKAGEPNIGGDEWQFGKLRYVAVGEQVAIVSYGPIMSLAKRVYAWLTRERKVSTSLISCHTLNPLDKAGLHRVMSRHSHVVVIEEAAASGSLGMRLRALAWEMGISQRDTAIHTFALQDRFSHTYGTHEQVLQEHGLTFAEITRKLTRDVCGRLVGREFVP